MISIFIISQFEDIRVRILINYVCDRGELIQSKPLLIDVIINKQLNRARVYDDSFIIERIIDERRKLRFRQILDSSILSCDIYMRAYIDDNTPRILSTCDLDILRGGEVNRALNQPGISNSSTT